MSTDYMQGKCATAPYNFVSYDPSNLLECGPDEELFSGTISCSLQALTPLLVGGPADKNSNAEGPSERSFFTLNDGRIAIPGTSLKGMLRSYVEAITRSKIEFISDKKIFYRHVTASEKSVYKSKFPKSNEPILGGFLYKDGAVYKLYPASVSRASEHGYGPEIYHTGAMEGKRKGYLFKRSSNTPVTLRSEVIADFYAQMTEAQKDNWKKEYDALNQGKGARVFYITSNGKSNGNIEAIGTSRYFRIAYKYTPKDLASKDFNFQRTNINDFSLHLFGIANKECAYKGKIAIEAAYFSEYRFEKKDEIVCILGNPKPSALLHYICQPKAKACKNKDELLNNYDQQSSLRGRKFYWHRDPEKSVSDAENSKVLSLLKPVAKGAKASFIVHLDRVNLTELGAILEALDLKEGHAHKLGSGKSLGLGSVRIDIKEALIINVNKKYRSLKERLKGEAEYLSQAELMEAREAFRDYATLKRAKSYAEQQHIKELNAMTDFKHRPSNELTKTMSLEKDKGEPNFAKSKALLLDPVQVKNGNKF